MNKSSVTAQNITVVEVKEALFIYADIPAAQAQLFLQAESRMRCRDAILC